MIRVDIILSDPKSFLSVIFRSLLFAHSFPDRSYGRRFYGHKRVTRNLCILQYPDHRTIFLEKAPWCSGTTIFHSLPNHIRNKTKTFNTFSFHFLIDNCFYNVQELSRLDVEAVGFVGFYKNIDRIFYKIFFSYF